MDPYLFNNENEAGENMQVFNPIITEERIVVEADPLALDIPDDELIKIVNKVRKANVAFWKDKYNLKARRTKMEQVLFGRELQELERQNKLKPYEARYSNNKIYEIEATLKPVAMSHMPDLIVTPGQQTEESEQSADDVSTAINEDIKKRENRQVLGIAFKHLPVYLTAVIKAIWDPQVGDYRFINIHPENVIIDSSATSANVDDMQYVFEMQKMTLQEIVMRWPSKKEAMFKKINGRNSEQGEDFALEDLATEFTLWQVWFTWYKQADSSQISENTPNFEEPGNKWEKIEGVLWKYEDIILDKIRNPNFDYEGEEQMFTYDDPMNENSKRQLSSNELMMGMMTGQLPDNIQSEQVYFNYFKVPHKPYFFMGYDQWGKVAIDETSRIEQNLYNQSNLNTIGKQIIDTLKTRTKHIWSGDGGLDGEAIQGMDMDNPKLNVLVDGDVNKVHSEVRPERPDQAQFNALGQTKEDMFGLAGATALTGQIQTDVATTNQIAREQNFTRADDLVEDTINAASEWMAKWSMQFIKLRYTEEKWRKLLGNKGKITFLSLKRDKIEDGMEVMIKSSGTDKVKAQRNAQDGAKLGPGFTDPISYFKDMEYSDPEERAQMAITFSQDPSTYMTKYIMGLDTVNKLAGQLGQDPNNPGQPPPNPMQQAAPPAAGVSNGGQNPTPTNTSQVATQQPAVPQGSPRLQ